MVGMASMPTVGFVFTVTVTVLVLLQPLPSVPVTVYVVVVLGVTLWLFPFKVPGSQSKLLLTIGGMALALMVPLAPAHKGRGPVVVILGKLYTSTSVVAVFVQPLPSVPVTVYTVYAVGLTLQVAVAGPPVQVYVLAPPPLSKLLLPLHIMGVPELAVTLGLVLPVTSIVAVFEQPAPLVPVTVYVVVPPLAVNGMPSLMPPLQLYKLAPVPLKVTCCV
jgi:hypothetical protein